MDPVRFGLVGYGTGGRYFHSPFIVAADGCALGGVVARSADKQQQVAADHPGVPVYSSLAAMLAGSTVDAVVITTPPATRVPLVLEAIAAGVPVVGDKPFAPDAALGRQLEQAADRAGVLLNAFHNRRWDADIRTLRGVLESGAIGSPQRFASRFDLYEPHTVESGPGGGVLSDLGSHLFDQALWLFGPAQRVYAELQSVEVSGGMSDGGFFVAVTHASGVVSHLTAGKLSRATGRELRLDGTLGTYRSAGADVQISAIFAGRRPAAEGNAWGHEDRSHWGVLTIADGERPVPSAQGRYQAFYEQFARAVRGLDSSPVPAIEAVAVLEVIDAARASAIDGCVVQL